MSTIPLLVSSLFVLVPNLLFDCFLVLNPHSCVTFPTSSIRVALLGIWFHTKGQGKFFRSLGSRLSVLENYEHPCMVLRGGTRATFSVGWTMTVWWTLNNFPLALIVIACPVISSSRTRGMCVRMAALIVYTTMLTGRLMFSLGKRNNGSGQQQTDWPILVKINLLINNNEWVFCDNILY